MCAPVVPATVASGHFEIVTKMNERVLRPERIRRLTLAGAASLVALSMLLIFFGLSSTAHAQEPKPTPAPANDCWNGALSSDPLHCYVLEEAEDAGHIDIAAMYRGGGVLFIYLTQTEPVGDSIRDYLRTKAQEEARRTGLYDCVLDLYGCRTGVLRTGTGFILPPSEVYEDIYLKPGGAEARRSEPGWPAFRQLWPSIAGEATGARGVASGFDVSEVDTTNFPDLVCAETKSNRPTYGGLFSVGEASRPWYRWMGELRPDSIRSDKGFICRRRERYGC